MKLRINEFETSFNKRMIYLINLASYPCPQCDSKELVAQVSVYATSPSLDQPVTSCKRARDIKDHWSVESFITCAEIDPVSYFSI